MKLNAGHLFLILLATVVFSCCLGGIKGLVEGMENNSGNTNNNGNKTITTSDGRSVTATHENTVLGIPKSQIPEGQEDLYILKTQIVTPVCPATPGLLNGNNMESISNGGDLYKDTSKCPPCPPCARCPDSPFECVKKPVYKPDNPYLPVPVLTSFSSFGM